MMKVISFLLSGASLVLAFAPPKSSSDCNKSSTSAVHGSSSLPYPTGTPSRLGYNGTYSYNSTSIVVKNSSKTVVPKPYETQPTNTFDAFPSDVFTSIPTLKPVMPADYDADSLDCLNPKIPGPGVPLHYAEESKPGSYEAGVFAVVIPKFNMPSVVLDYANAASVVKIARGGDLIIGFSDLAAFLRSVSSWQSLKEIVFVTFTEGCGDYADGERCYFLASQLYFDRDSLTVRAVGKPRDVRDLVEHINVSWGSYQDEQFNGASPVASGTATPVASGTGSFPTVTPGSSTNGTNSSTVDFGKNGPCNAPADVKYGLPSVCNGPHFDETLDEKLGYKTSKDFAWSDWVETVSLVDPYTEPEIFNSDGSPSTGLNKRGLKDGFMKLGSKTGKFFKEKKDDLKKKINNAGNNIGAVVKGTVNGAVAVGKFAKNVITGQPNIYEKEFNKLILPPKKDNPECVKKGKKCDIQAKGAKAVKSPWDDDGFLLATFGKAPSESELIKGRKTKMKVKGQFLNIYCVKCGLHGSAKIVGNLLIKGTEVHEGKIEVDMNLEVGLGIGIYAQYIHSQNFDLNLFNVPVSPFTIGVLTIGPYISIGTRATFKVNATGTVLARADLKFAKAKFSYDFKNKVSKQIGFNPQFVPKFEADGELGIEATFGVPVALKVGLSTFKGCTRCEAAIGIEDYPHIKIEARGGLEASWGGENVTTLLDDKANSTFKGGIKTINNCTGIWAGLSIGNTLGLVFNGFGFAKQNFELWNMPAYELKSWCLGTKVNGTEKKKESKRFLLDDHAYDFKNYPRDGTNDTSALVNLAEYVISDVDEPSWDGVEIPNLSYELGDDFEGFWYTTVVYGHGGEDASLDAAINLVACNDGNLYMQENKTTNSLDEYKTCASLWGGYDDAILSDPNGGFLYYYHNTMSKVGVSRARTAYAQEVPDTASMVVLAPFYYDETNEDASILTAFDSDDNMFLPVVCTYSDSPSAKIFLVEDLEKGIAMLKSGDLKYTVANGDVADCALLPLTWGADTEATESDWASLADTDFSEFDFETEIEFDEDEFKDGAWVDDGLEEEEWFDEFDELMFEDDEYFE